MAGTDLMGLVKLTPLAKAINALNAAADVLIAAVMVYLLRQGRTGIGASDSMINQLASHSLS
jgi:ammonia channel protein AmtB